MDSKVIYIGNYRDGTGWGNAALHTILAMDKAGIDVVPKCITFERNHINVPERINELERKSASDAKIVIQHTLPPIYHNNSNYYNIGFYETESEFGDCLWPKFINRMDQAWVANEKSKVDSQLSGVRVPINVVNHCIDVDKYHTDSPTVIVPEIKNTFNFLFIGEVVERKNLEALVKAFHCEFHHTENVNLVLKLKIPQISDGKEAYRVCTEYINDIKAKLKIKRKLKGDVVFCGHLDFEQYRSIISQCHCFVMPSRGEACCIPAIEAGAMGLPVLYTDGNGMEDYCSLDKINAVSSINSPCYATFDTIDEIQTAENSWKEASVSNLMEKMRGVYNAYMLSKGTYVSFSDKQKEKSRAFNYESVGRKIKEILNDSTGN